MPVLFRKAGTLADQKADLPSSATFVKKSIDLVDSEVEESKSASEQEIIEKKKKSKKCKKEKSPEEIALKEKLRRKEDRKRRRLEEEEAAIYAKYETMEVKKPKIEGVESKKGVYFRRLGDESQWLVKAVVQDNSHWTAKKGGDAWGAKAAEDLIKVRGRGFKKEMQKKKRSSWCGAGLLESGVNSIVYDDSD